MQELASNYDNNRCDRSLSFCTIHHSFIHSLPIQTANEQQRIQYLQTQLAYHISLVMGLRVWSWQLVCCIFIDSLLQRGVNMNRIRRIYGSLLQPSVVARDTRLLRTRIPSRNYSSFYNGVSKFWNHCQQNYRWDGMNVARECPSKCSCRKCRARHHVPNSRSAVQTTVQLRL